MIMFNYLIMCIIFGTTFLAIKIGIDAGLPPFLSAGARFFLAGLLLAAWLLASRKTSVSSMLRKEFVYIGLGMTFITFGTIYWAEQHISSGLAAVLTATGPLQIIILQRLFLRISVGIITVAGCLIGLIGVMILIMPSLSAEHDSEWFLGCLFVILGECGYAAAALYASNVMKRNPAIPPIVMNAAQMTAGGFTLLLLSLLTESSRYQWPSEAAALLSLLYLILVGSMLGHSLFYWLLAKTNPLFPSTWLYISPIIALLAGAVFYNEPIGWLSAAGTVLVLAGVLITNGRLLHKLHTYLQRTDKAKKQPI